MAPLMVIVPSLPPKQVTLVLAIDAFSIAGWVITSDEFSVIIHAGVAASLILTSYVPTARLLYVPDPCHEVPPFIV